MITMVMFRLMIVGCASMDLMAFLILSVLVFRTELYRSSSSSTSTSSSSGTEEEQPTNDRRPNGIPALWNYCRNVYCTRLSFSESQSLVWEQRSPGMKMRQSLYVLFCMATVFRGVSMGIQLLVVVLLGSTSHRVSKILLDLISFVHWLPMCMLVSMYSFWFVSWAQLCHTAWGPSINSFRVMTPPQSTMASISSWIGYSISSIWLRPVCLLLNGLLYAVCCISFFVLNLSTYWQVMERLLIGFYTGLFVLGMIYSQALLHVFSRSSSSSIDDDPVSILVHNHNGHAPQGREDEEDEGYQIKTTLAHRVMLNRLWWIRILCCTLFLINMIFFTSMAFDWMPVPMLFLLGSSLVDDEDASSCLYEQLMWNSATYFVIEFLPLLAIVVVTWRNTTTTTQSLDSSNSSHSSSPDIAISSQENLEVHQNSRKNPQHIPKFTVNPLEILHQQPSMNSSSINTILAHGSAARSFQNSNSNTTSSHVNKKALKNPPAPSCLTALVAQSQSTTKEYGSRNPTVTVVTSATSLLLDTSELATKEIKQPGGSTSSSLAS